MDGRGDVVSGWEVREDWLDTGTVRVLKDRFGAVVATVTKQGDTGWTYLSSRSGMVKTKGEWEANVSCLWALFKSRHAAQRWCEETLEIWGRKP